MNRVIEKIFSLLFSKRKTIFLVLFFIIWGVLIPSRTAFAAWYDFLIGAFISIPMLGIALVLVVATGLSSLLAAFGGVVLNWVLGPNFIINSATGQPWSYTNPATNPIIKIGLDITQPFVNMILVLVLVFIALATILRLADYETKKLLPIFIIVALLVNFAPVICGLIVDASNIVMNFFIKEITGGKQLISSLKSLGDTLVGGISWETFKATKQLELVLTLIVFIVVNLALFLILLLFAFVFAARYLAIWTLVILSPLAFVCYILPATRKFWNLWWNQFVQWSIIGITMGFFLYLADQFTVLNPTHSAEGLGGAILPTLLPLVFLYLGFIFGLSAGAMGASGVIGFTKGAGKWTGAKAWTGAKSWVEEKARIPRIPWGKTEEGIPRKVGIKEAAGWGVKKWEKAPIARWFLPEAMVRYGEYRSDIEAAEKKIEGISSPHACYRHWAGKTYGIESAGMLRGVIGRGDSQDWYNSFKQERFNKYFKDMIDEKTGKPYENWSKVPNKVVDANKEFKEETGRLLQIAQMGGLHQVTLRSAPRLARAAFGKLKGYTTADGILDEDMAVRKAVKESRNQHIKNWEPEEMEDEAVIAESLTRGRDFWQAFFSQVKRGHEVGLNVFKNEFKKFLEATPKAQAKPVLEAWEDFKEARPESAGFFQFLEGPRAREQGWTKERVIELATGQRIPPEGSPTPGEAAGIEIVTPVGARRKLTEEEIAERKGLREEMKKEKEAKKKGPPEPSAGI